MTPREDSITLEGPDGPLEIACTAWGRPGVGRSVVCLHGLTRNGRDFDRLAAALAAPGRHVICPDMPGRGRSGWLDDPSRYTVPVYADLSLNLLQALGLGRVDWVGTSMGGLIGMTLAARKDSPIARLVLNDIGPLVPKEALALIADHVGRDPRFDDVDALEAHLRAIHAGFGELDDAAWRHLARHGARPTGDGRLALAYDPRIAEAFREQAEEDLDLWEVYDAVTCPTLVLRGGDSLLLTATTAREMTERGPRAEIVTFPGVGHAPSLMVEAQIAVVRRFLDAPR
jgi:pimeloyl-ACP methyl ester carboxylesterase